MGFYKLIFSTFIIKTSHLYLIYILTDITAAKHCNVYKTECFSSGLKIIVFSQKARLEFLNTFENKI